MSDAYPCHVNFAHPVGWKISFFPPETTSLMMGLLDMEKKMNAYNKAQKLLLEGKEPFSSLTIFLIFTYFTKLITSWSFWGQTLLHSYIISPVWFLRGNNNFPAVLMCTLFECSCISMLLCFIYIVHNGLLMNNNLDHYCMWTLFCCMKLRRNHLKSQIEFSMCNSYYYYYYFVISAFNIDLQIFVMRDLNNG